MLLLSPGTPMLFQGQEFSASSPFHYFNDAGPDRREGVFRSRVEFLSQFPSLSTEEARAVILDPTDIDTFRSSKIKDADRDADPAALALHRDLIRVRRDDPVFASQGGLGVDGAVLGPESFVLRHNGVDGDDRLILVNFGADFTYTPISEPLLAPPEGRGWQVLWSSESVIYGGDGTPPVVTEEGWRLPRESAIVLDARPRDEGCG
jgi:maltooligosyltrehalose trehalohydrolase